MHTEFLMGNAAIARGAIAAGVNVVAGYPGTPSTEVLETVAKEKPETTYVEWSDNEKAAMELAGGASMAGARSMVTMKQMGLNVSSDPLLCQAYLGVKGGMVVMVADDPGPVSSQTEQDTRHFASFSKVPCFDPSSAQEAYDMIQDAFVFSEKYGTPVFFRPTTRVCHGYASVTVKDPEEYTVHEPEGFVKDSNRWVIFPRLSFTNHQKIVVREKELSDDFSAYERNRIHPADPQWQDTKKGIASGGISDAYVMETLKKTGMVRHFKVTTPYPFPENKALEFLTGLDEVLCVEELDPVIERELIYLCGKYHLDIRIRGKLTGDVAPAGENTRDSVDAAVRAFLEIPEEKTSAEGPDAAGSDAAGSGAEGPEAKPPALPVRPPVLCAGCPHRASFYAVKKAMEGKKTLFCGDIGCYTLGNAMPLDMVDTCLCMGAGVNMAQGVKHVEPDRTCFAFVGDSTFFASAITGVVNAVYNQTDMILVILDNSTTAMTGHQPHPGTGIKATGERGTRVDMEQVLKGIGVTQIETIDPLELEASVDCVKRMAEKSGVRAIIFRSPCIAVTRSHAPLTVDTDTCINCKKCIREIGCPAISIEDGQVTIDAGTCTGCTLCRQVCPTGAIRSVSDAAEGGERHE